MMDLKPFCASAGSDQRAFLCSPFVHAGRAMACNGHILIALDDPVDGLAPIDLKILPTIDQMLADIDAARGMVAGWTKAADIGACTDMCPACKGVGKIRHDSCDDCDGDGHFDHGRHEYQCKECRGKGGEDIPDPNGSHCRACRGAGTEGRAASTHGARTSRGWESVASMYVHMLRAMPGCELQPVSAECRCTFRFDGGVGMVMTRTGEPLPVAKSDRAPLEPVNV